MEKTNNQKLNESINACYENLDAVREDMRNALLEEKEKLNKIKGEVKEVKEQQIDYVHQKLQEALTFHFKLNALFDKEGKTTEISMAMDTLIKEKLSEVFKKIKEEKLV